jgi:hypothetical protein
VSVVKRQPKGLPLITWNDLTTQVSLLNSLAVQTELEVYIFKERHLGINRIGILCTDDWTYVFEPVVRNSVFKGWVQVQTVEEASRWIRHFLLHRPDL